MAEQNRAIGVRRDGEVRYNLTGEIPSVDQWFRDYVDKRSVYDGMVVLEATVNGDGVEQLVINARCATDRAENLHDGDANVEISYNLG